MRVFTLTAGLVSVCFLLGCLPSIFALPNSNQPSDEYAVSDEDAVDLPNYALYGGPPANRGAYDYVTITYGGYGPPPPPPSSSSIVTPSYPSSFNQSVTGTATSSIVTGSPSSLTVSVSSGKLHSFHNYKDLIVAHSYPGLSLSSASSSGTATTTIGSELSSETSSLGSLGPTSFATASGSSSVRYYSLFMSHASHLSLLSPQHSFPPLHARLSETGEFSFYPYCGLDNVTHDTIYLEKGMLNMASRLSSLRRARRARRPRLSRRSPCPQA